LRWCPRALRLDRWLRLGVPFPWLDEELEFRPQFVPAAAALEADRRVVTGLEEDPVADAAAGDAAELLPDVDGANLPLRPPPPLPAPAPLVDGESVDDPAPPPALPTLPRAAVS